MGHRQGEGLQEELWRQVLAEWLQKQEFLAGGQPGGAERTVGEVAQGPSIGFMEEHAVGPFEVEQHAQRLPHLPPVEGRAPGIEEQALGGGGDFVLDGPLEDRKSTRLNSSHVRISYAVFCLKKKRIE